jgi:hypothetical protein
MTSFVTAGRNEMCRTWLDAGHSDVGSHQLVPCGCGVGLLCTHALHNIQEHRESVTETAESSKVRMLALNNSRQRSSLVSHSGGNGAVVHTATALYTTEQ